MLARVLVIATEQDLRRSRRALSGPDTMVATGATSRELWRELGTQAFDLVVVARGAVPDLNQGTVTQIRDLPDRPDVVVLSDRDDPEGHADLLSAGCLAVVDSRMEDREYLTTLQALVARRFDEAPVSREPASDAAPQRHSGFESESARMQEVLATAHRIALSDSTLLLLGETGVGKEWLARCIHGASPRSGGPFVAINCAALSDALLESDLFGHVKGAYTGAHQPRRGAFELAHAGTLFLDEIAELPTHLQSRLLRALENRQIHPVGSERAIDVDVRVMAATNRDLEVEMREGRFRRDLYYRLNVVSLTVPALRERREDVPALAQRYFDEFRLRLGADVERIRPDALERLCAYAWPGNVRELVNAIERAALLCAGPELTPADLPSAMLDGEVPARPASAERADASVERADALDPTGFAGQSWSDVREAVLARTEVAYLSDLLTRTRGAIGEAAALAGLAPRSLYAMMRRNGLRKEQFRGRR